MIDPGHKTDEKATDEIMREETPDISKIYCFGDSRNFFKFSIGPMLWHEHKLDDKSPYEGNLKYFSVAFVPDRKLLMAGGVYTSTQQPNNGVFMIDL
jgi:hypothetical protein